MAKGQYLDPMKMLDQLKDSEINVFYLDDLAECYDVHRTTAWRKCEALVSRGELKKVRPGVYKVLEPK